MPQEKNTLLRIAIPVVLLLGGIGLLFAVARNTGQQQQRSASGETAKAAAGSTASGSTSPGSATPPVVPQAVTPGGTPAAGSPEGTPGQPPVMSAGTPGPKGLRAAAWPADTKVPTTALGELKSAVEGGTYQLRVVFSPIGAGVESISAANHKAAVKPGSQNAVIQESAKLAVGTRTVALVPFSLLGITVNDTTVNLAASADGPLWKESAPGVFDARIVDEAGTVALRVTRTFTLAPGSHDLELSQTVENLTGVPLTIRWVQMGPVDPPQDSTSTYDYRRVRLAYLTPVPRDPAQATVVAGSNFVYERPTIVGTPVWNTSLGRFDFAAQTIWPDPKGRSAALTLAWAGTTNHYFAAVMHALPDRTPARTDLGAPVKDKRLPATETLDRIAITSGTVDAATATAEARFGLRLTSAAVTVAPGASAGHAIGIYAGPMSGKPEYTGQPPAIAGLNLSGLVLYYIGGPCAWCMFQPVASTLHWYLLVLHDYVVFDWALGIIVLVLTLRTLLHPMTKWSQRSMITMGKRMSALAPKQKKLQEKFGDDPARLRQEQAKLMQEEGLGAAGMLGCMPMFIQMLVNTPIWIALSSAIGTAFELRHEAGFFGIFQTIGSAAGVWWPFLADLSDHDRFIPLPQVMHVTLPLIGRIDAINLLPILLGVFFYIQQKYLTPPPTTELTPEQEQQQRIMKIMMVVMFPLMMYTQPAALVLYFAVNSIFGTLEAAHIRKQFEKELAAAPPGQSIIDRKTGRDPTKKPGFFERIRIQIELAQKLREQQHKDKDKDKKRTR